MTQQPVRKFALTRSEKTVLADRGPLQVRFSVNRHRSADYDAEGRACAHNLRHLEASILQKVTELLRGALQRRVLNHHVQVRKLALRALIRWTDDSFDNERSRRGSHRFTADAENGDRSIVVPVMKYGFHHIGIAASRNGIKEVSRNDPAALGEAGRG